MDSNPSKQVANNLAAICNIPKSFHSADLRNYFSQIIEQEVFSCFHFKHRPEIKRGGVYGKQISDTCVCVVSLCEPAAFEKLKAYEGNNWIDKSGEYLQTKCKVVKLFTCMNESLEQQKYLTKQDKNYKSRHAPLEEFSKNDLQNLSELNPPRHVMPNGNVGTPIPVFLKLIQNCKLPTSVIKKLGLVFPTTASHRKYGNVPYAYDEESEPISSAENMFTMTTGNEVNILPNAEMMYKSDYQADNPDVSESNDIPGKQESDSDDDDDTCEEWERHEAFHNDVTSQERDKERLFEDEIELKWEKGGSGLVFYTDAQYWAEEDGDFDEQNTDQWDVDTSEFYGNDGDRDAKDFVQICKEKRLHSGNSLLSKRTCKTKDQFGGTMGSSNTNTVGRFETYTKGIGRKILKKFGWKDNEGLGASGKSGITEPIVAEGQEPNQKNGLGFYGENILNNAIKSTGKKYVTNVQVKQMQKLDSSVTHKAVEPLASHSYLFPQFRSNLVSVSSKHKPLSKQKRQKAVPGNDGIIITTKYDAPLDIDEDSGYLRSQHPYSLKHSSAKSHAADSFEPDKKHDVLASTSKLVYHKTRTSVNDETSLPCNANKRTAGFTPHMHFVRPVSETEWTLFPS